jgi:multiple sugar transport system substrate-binding protein
VSAGGLRGMTWDHPRAYLGLEAFEAAGTAPRVAWDRQPLAAFEAHPIDDLARRYDFMIIDHPGLGSALRAEALAPLEEVVGEESARRWSEEAVGASGASYRLGGRTWALPVDAAAQVSVRRSEVPAVRRWEEVAAVAAEHPVALCLAGPHAMLMLLALCSRQRPADETVLLDPAVAADAIAVIRAVYAVADRELSLRDPIGVHDGIAAGGGATWCPLAYGYVSYARPAAGEAALAWSDAPSWRGEEPLSVLGGTGLAVAARSAADPDVRAWIEAFLAELVQTGLVPEAGGQPAHRSVWRAGSAADEGWGRFYSATAATLAAAWVRPRVPGWIGLQDQGSELVREAVVSGADPGAAIAEINHAYAALLREAEQMTKEL